MATNQQPLPARYDSLPPEDRAFLEKYLVKKPKPESSESPGSTLPARYDSLPPEDRAFLEKYLVKKPKSTLPTEPEKPRSSNLLKGVARGVARGGMHIASWGSKALQFINPTGKERTEGELAGLNERKSRAELQAELEAKHHPEFFAEHEEGFAGSVEDLISDSFPAAVESYVMAAGNPALATQFFLARSAGKGVEASSKGLGFSNRTSNIAGDITELLLSFYNPKKVTQVAKNLYKQAEHFLPSLEGVSASKVAEVSAEANRLLKSADYSIPVKAVLRPLVKEFESVFSPYVKKSKYLASSLSHVPVQDILSQKRFVNQKIGEVLLDGSLSSADRNNAFRLLSKYSQNISDAAFSVKGAGAEQFIKLTKAADAAYQTVAQNPVIPKAIARAWKNMKSGKIASSGLTGSLLYHLGFLGPIVKTAGIAAPVALIGGHSNAIVQRVMRNKKLRDFYIKALWERAAFQAEDVVRTVNDLNDAMQSEDEK